jgi:hypothetical protein
LHQLLTVGALTYSAQQHNTVKTVPGVQCGGETGSSVNPKLGGAPSDEGKMITAQECAVDQVLVRLVDDSMFEADGAGAGSGNDSLLALPCCTSSPVSDSHNIDGELLEEKIDIQANLHGKTLVEISDYVTSLQLQLQEALVVIQVMRDANGKTPKGSAISPIAAKSRITTNLTSAAISPIAANPQIVGVSPNWLTESGTRSGSGNSQPESSAQGDSLGSTAVSGAQIYAGDDGTGVDQPALDSADGFSRHKAFTDVQGTTCDTDLVQETTRNGNPN